MVANAKVSLAAVYQDNASEPFIRSTDRMAKSSDKLGDELKETAGAHKKAEGAAKKHAKESGGLNKTLDKGVANLKSYVVGTLAAAAGVAAITQGLKGSVAVALEHADAIALAERAGFQNVESLNQQAEAMQRASGVSSDAILTEIARTRAMNDTVDAVELVQASLDLAAATGKDFSTIVTQLQGTLAGLVEETLGKAVPALRSMSKEALASGGAIEFVARKFGGQAALDANSLSGSVRVAEKSLEDVQNAVGDLILQFARMLSGEDGIKSASDAFDKWSTAIGSVTTALQGLSGVDIPFIGDELGIVADAYERIAKAHALMQSGDVAGTIAGLGVLFGTNAPTVTPGATRGPGDLGYVPNSALPLDRTSESGFQGPILTPEMEREITAREDNARLMEVQNSILRELGAEGGLIPLRGQGRDLTTGGDEFMKRHEDRRKAFLESMEERERLENAASAQRVENARRFQQEISSVGASLVRAAWDGRDFREVLDNLFGDLLERGAEAYFKSAIGSLIPGLGFLGSSEPAVAGAGTPVIIEMNGREVARGLIPHTDRARSRGQVRVY